MKNIASSKSHVLVIADKSVKLYNKPDLEHIIDIPVPDVSTYFLHDTFLFISRKSGRLEAFHLSSFHSILIADSPKSIVISLYSRDNLLYVGTENGILRTYLFNEFTFKMNNEYKHNGPITSIASDGITTLVTDHLQRITEYPSNRIYDFKNPEIFSGRYLMCVEGPKLYIRTNEAFGQFYQAEQPIEDLFLSEKGGFIFIRNGSVVICIDSATGEIKGEYILGECVVGKEALISYSNDGFEIIDLFFEDKEMEDIKFRSINILEKKREGEESDKRHLYVQDGGGKSVGRTKGSKEGVQRGVSINDYTIKKQKKYKLDDEDKRYRGRVGSTVVLDRRDGSAVAVSNNENITNTGKPSFIEGVGCMSRSFKQNDATLLYFSSEGYMISIETPVSNRVSVKYHDNSIEPLEFKDPERSTLGCFYGRKFVVSNGNIVNYNDEWSKEIKCKMVGLNETGVFVFGEVVSVYGFDGILIEEFLFHDYYTFCITTNKIAIFCLLHVTIIEYDGLGGRTGVVIPIGKVSFCTFYGPDLYVERNGAIFKAEGCLFVKQCVVKGHPLAICNEFVLTLSEPPVLLPRPVISYNELNPNRKVQKGVSVEATKEKSVKYSILEQ